jgi:hypothetical protein
MAACQHRHCLFLCQVSVATFACYVLLGNELTAAKAFTSLSLFTVLRMPLMQLPQLISQFVNARVSLWNTTEMRILFNGCQIGTECPILHAK